jgi:hypothetical protein
LGLIRIWPSSLWFTVRESFCTKSFTSLQTGRCQRPPYVIATGAAKLIAPGAANLTGAGAANLIAPGAANLIAPGAAKLIAAG